MSKVINFDKVSHLTSNFILSQITELEIYRYYIGSNIKVGDVIKSPLRKDLSPSFGLYKGSNWLTYKDFATRDTGNCFNLVCNLFGCNYPKALEIIAKDFKLTDYTTTTLRRKEENPVESILDNFEKKIIPVKRGFNDIDYNYWNQFYIPLDYLIQDNTYACKYVYLNREPNSMILWGEETKSDPIYCIELGTKHKIYRPLTVNKSQKWLGTCTNYDIFGMNKIPEKGELLIITSSMKDRWVLKRLGYTSIAPQSESTTIPNKIMNYLFACYKRIILFYDNDEAGREFTNKMINLYPELQAIFIPNKYTEKDISDFTKIYKLDRSKKLMNSLI